MKILLALTLALSVSEAAMAEMVCSEAFGETICRDSNSGQEVRCREQFGETVCRNTSTGQETHCRTIYGKTVCR